MAFGQRTVNPSQVQYTVYGTELESLKSSFNSFLIETKFGVDQPESVQKNRALRLLYS